MIFCGTSVQRLLMLRYLLYFSVVLLLTPANILSGETSSHCINSLVLPTANVFSRNVAAGGIVTAVVLIGQNGRISRLDTEGPTNALKAEVEVYLRESQFAATCAGRKVRLTFEYKLEGEPSYNLVPPKIVFHPPLSFTIIVRPGKLTMN